MSQAGPSNHKPQPLIFYFQLQALPHVGEEWQGQSKGAGVLGRGFPSSPRREHRGHGQVSVALMEPGLGVHLPLWPAIWAVYHGHSNPPGISQSSSKCLPWVKRGKRCGWRAGRASSCTSRGVLESASHVRGWQSRVFTGFKTRFPNPG